jgi:hypothetical protein
VSLHDVENQLLGVIKHGNQDWMEEGTHDARNILKHIESSLIMA